MRLWGGVNWSVRRSACHCHRPPPQTLCAPGKQALRPLSLTNSPSHLSPGARPRPPPSHNWERQRGLASGVRAKLPPHQRMGFCSDSATAKASGALIPLALRRPVVPALPLGPGVSADTAFPQPLPRSQPSLVASLSKVLRDPRPLRKCPPHPPPSSWCPRG